MLKYKACPTLPQGGLDIGLKVGILAEIGYMLQECALPLCFELNRCKKLRFLGSYMKFVLSAFLPENLCHTCHTLLKCVQLSVQKRFFKAKCEKLEVKKVHCCFYIIFC